MPRAIVVERTGGPEVLQMRDVPVPEPGPGQVRIRQGAVGVNFIDVYYRMGLYKAGSLPFVPGMEGAGVIEAVGAGVTDLRAQQRVAYPAALGAYAEERVLPAEKVVALPDE